MLKNFLNKIPWVKLLVILITVLSLMVIFYWYSWQPAEARKACDNEARETVKVNIEKKNIENSTDLYNSYNVYYARCLHQKGYK